MATTMALVNLSGSFCTKFLFATRLSNCIRLKTNSIKNDHFQQRPSVQVRTLWASSTTASSKQIDQTSSTDRKPKHPPNVFIMYLQKNQEQFQKENPAASRTDIVAIASKKWKNVDPEEKSQLSMRRKELFEKYKEDKKQYIDSMTPEEMRLEERKKQQTMIKKLRQARKELGKPRMPASGFCCFMADQYPQHAGEDEEVTKTFKKLRDHWNNLGDKEKEKYQQQSAQRSEVYKQEMEVWENEMMEMGRFDVIRKTTLLRLAKANNPKKNMKKSEEL